MKENEEEEELGMVDRVERGRRMGERNSNKEYLIRKKSWEGNDDKERLRGSEGKWKQKHQRKICKKEKGNNIQLQNI